MTTAGPTVGVLALQGDFREQAQVLEGLGARVRLVRSPDDLSAVSGLVIPGGESSVIDKLARRFGLMAPIRARLAAGLPAFGTCAGLIMLADEVRGGIDGQQTFGGLDVVVRRNAFGAQVRSFETTIVVPELGEQPVTAVFIRGPVIESVGPRARVLAELDDGRVVAVEQGVLLGTAFHPEVTGETRFHQRFLANVRAAG